MSATAAPTELHVSEARDVPPFDRIDLRDRTNWVDLTAEPGDSETLEVEGPPEMIARVHTWVEGDTLRITLAGSVADLLRDAVTTSLTRKHLVYRIRVRRLLEVRVAGLVRVSVHAFGKDAHVVTRLEPQPPAVPRPPVAPRPPA
jgi:hypothetical protein